MCGRQQPRQQRWGRACQRGCGVCSCAGGWIGRGQFMLLLPVPACWACCRCQPHGAAPPPQVVIIDEISSAKEVTAAKTIAHRGVVLVRRGGARCAGLHTCSSAQGSTRVAATSPPTCCDPAHLHLSCVHDHAPDYSRLPTHARPAPPLCTSTRQVGTAHGKSLRALMQNGELNGLVGGLTSVTLGDEAAKRDNNGCAMAGEGAGRALSALRWGRGRGERLLRGPRRAPARLAMHASFPAPPCIACLWITPAPGSPFTSPFACSNKNQTVRAGIPAFSTLVEVLDRRQGRSAAVWRGERERRGRRGRCNRAPGRASRSGSKRTAPCPAAQAAPAPVAPTHIPRTSGTALGNTHRRSANLAMRPPAPQSLARAHERDSQRGRPAGGQVGPAGGRRRALQRRQPPCRSLPANLCMSATCALPAGLPVCLPRAPACHTADSPSPRPAPPAGSPPRSCVGWSQVAA